MVKVPLTITIEHTKLNRMKDLPIGQQRILKRKASDYLCRKIDEQSAEENKAPLKDKINALEQKKEKLQAELEAKQSKEAKQSAQEKAAKEKVYAQVHKLKKRILELLKKKPTPKAWLEHLEAELAAEFGGLECWPKFSNKVCLALNDKQEYDDLKSAIENEINTSENKR